MPKLVDRDLEMLRHITPCGRIYCRRDGHAFRIYVKTDNAALRERARALIPTGVKPGASAAPGFVTVRAERQVVLRIAQAWVDLLDGGEPLARPALGAEPAVVPVGDQGVVSP